MILILLLLVILFYVRRKESFKISNYKIGKSNIHGNGVIATSFIPEGLTIGVALVNMYITPYFGKYVNHCDKPSTYMKKIGDKYVLISIRDINSGEEITCDYNQAKSVANFIAPPKKYYKC